MKKLMLVREILNGLVKLVKSIRCRSSCCQSSCNEPPKCECNHNEIKNVVEL